MTDQRSKVNSDGTENPIFLPTGAFAPARRKRRRVRVKCTVNFRAPCSVISVRPAPRDLAPRPCKILRPAPVTFASAADIFPPTAPARTFTRHRCPHNRLRLLTHCPRAPYPACFCDRFRIAVRPLLSRAFIHIFKYARISSLRGFPLCRPLPRLLCAPSRAYRLPPLSCG